MTLSDYFPVSGSVRLMLAQDGGTSRTQLVPVEELPRIAAENPAARISVSYATHQGGQKDRNVVEVLAVAGDCDGDATLDHVRMVQERFPGAAVILSNGLMTLHRIPAGMTWAAAALLEYQVGCEVERLTWLHFDWKTLFRGDGTPGDHRGHLFRYGGGWAHRANRAVQYFEPLDSSRSLVSDAAGLAYPLPTGAGDKKPAKGNSRPAGGGTKRGGSIDTSKCSALLKARFSALRQGKSIEEAAAIAAATVGVPVSDVRELYSREGFEAPVIREFQRFTAADDTDCGIVGLVGSKRGIQRTFTWWGNFGHSAQSFWDVCRDVETAFQGFLHFPELRVFCDHFRKEFGKDWLVAMREDLERLHRKFGKFGGARREVSDRCLDRIREALAKEPASAVELKQRSKVSIRQVKRALVELAKRSEVVASGKTKAKRWSLSTNNSCHTVNSKKTGMRVKLSVLTPEHRVGGKPVVRRKVRRAEGCPKNTKRSRMEYLAERRIAKRSRLADKLEMKNQLSRGEIIALALTVSAKKYWLSQPVDFRLLRGWWFHARQKNPRIGSFEDVLERESLNPQLAARLRRAAARGAENAAVNREINAREKAAKEAAARGIPAVANADTKVAAAEDAVARAFRVAVVLGTIESRRRVCKYQKDWSRRVDQAGGFRAAVLTGDPLATEPLTELV